MNTITLYTQPGCGPCIGVKSWLKSRKLAFTEVNVRKEPGALEAITALGYTGTPVTIVNDGIGDIHFYGADTTMLERFCGEAAA